MLNKAQQLAVDSNDRRIVCLAGAGTGKSTALLARISRLIDDGVNPHQILALTFTNAAAFEMKDRFLTAHPHGECPEFRTFHSFCYHLITIDSDILKKLGYSKVPGIADDTAEKRIIREAKMQTNCKLSEKKIFGKEPLSQSEAKDLFILLKAADRLMKQRNLITFDKLSKSVCDLFISNDSIVTKYKNQFKYVMCDEYQDTDTCQHDFLMSFHDSNIFVVGDALQNLYSFRGTSSKMIKDLSTDSNWTTIKLYENYRSTKPICEYANKYSKSYAKESYRIAIEATKEGSSVDVRHYTPYSKGVIPTKIVDKILEESSQMDGTTAILVRSNAEVKSITDYLFEKKIPFMSKRSDSNGHNILKCVLDDNYTIEWLATMLSSEMYSEYIRRSAIKTQTKKPYTLSGFTGEFGTNADIQSAVNKIYKIRKICGDRTSIAVKQQSILRVLGYDPKLKVDLSDVKVLSDMLSKLAEALETYSGDAVKLYVGTVHSVKGLEYDNVYVVGPRSISWPLSYEDNHNLFYVAVTRAKTNLVVYFAQQGDD